MSEIKKVKINDFKVKPIEQDGAGVDTRPILGHDLIPHLYCTMFLVAKKKTGKTTVVNTILKHCAGRDTEVIVFCATLHKDPSWAKIRENLEKRGVGFQGFTDLIDSGTNLLKEWMDQQSKGDDGDGDGDGDPGESDQKEVVTGTVRSSNAYLLTLPAPVEDDTFKAKSKPRKSKYQMPETIFVFDDFSKELRNPVVADFIKRHRHYKTKVIISSQYVKDIVPATAQNIDLWLLFRGRNQRELEHIYNLANPSMSFETFSMLYKDATGSRHGFLYADVTNDEYRDTFSHKYAV